MINRVLLTPFLLDRPAPELRRLARAGWSINESSVEGAGGPLAGIAAVNERIARFTADAVTSGARPVCVSGDCCAAIGAITGLQRAGLSPRVLWLDAHGDFNTPDTTPTGFLGGMPLAMLTGRGDVTILDRLRTRVVRDDAVILCDARDLDSLERDALAASRVTHLTSLADLDALDFGSGPIHLHLDPDVVDGPEVPAMSHATPDGPSASSVIAALSRLERNGVKVSSVSLTTWMLDRDGAHETEAAVWRVLAAAVGAI
jgi:arginase